MTIFFSASHRRNRQAKFDAHALSWDDNFNKMLPFPRLWKRFVEISKSSKSEKSYRKLQEKREKKNTKQEIKKELLANASRKELLCSCYKSTSWMGWLLYKEGFVCQENLSTCNNSWRTVLSLRLLLSLQCVCDNKLTPFISENGFGCNVMDSYFSLLNLSFAENYHISIFTTFEKQSMINRLSNPINRNRSAAKISKVMSSSAGTLIGRDGY